MADLFLDIRGRLARALVAENGEVRFHGTYDLDTDPTGAVKEEGKNPGGDDHLREGEIAFVLNLLRTECSTKLEQAHVIVPDSYVIRSTHKTPHMPQAEALKLIRRKIAAEVREEEPQIQISPLASVANTQTWLVEYISSDTLRFLKREFGRVRPRTVTTGTNAILNIMDPVRESIFNAHAVFEINESCIEAYYISSSNLLLRETLLVSDEDDERQTARVTEQSQKWRFFAILDLLYRSTAKYLAANAMTPLQKIWLCGTDQSISELSGALRDAMDTETVMLCDQEQGMTETCPFAAVSGFMLAIREGRAVNFMHPDLLRRFPLRKKTGLLIYIGSAILVTAFAVMTEARLAGLKSRLALTKKEHAASTAANSASSTVAKNLEKLRQLTGSHIVFYPLLRQLAMELPDGVYLDGLTYSLKDKGSQLELTATFSHSDELGAKKTLSQLMEMLRKSPHLTKHSEPAVTIAAKGAVKLVTVKLNCEVVSSDQAK